MKNAAHLATTDALPQQPRRAGDLRRSRRGARAAIKASQSRAQEKHGAYKRFEIFLGVQAAIALRRLMRDGRSAREVIEALLLSENEWRGRKHRPAPAGSDERARHDG